MITKIEISGVPPFMEKVILETDKKVNLIYCLIIYKNKNKNAH